MKTLVDTQTALNRKDFESVARDTVQLSGMKKADYVNKTGFGHLRAAAASLLMLDRIDLKITARSARNAIIESFDSYISKAQKSKVFSYKVIIDGASSRLVDLKREDGRYVIAVRLASLSRKSDFRVGPIRIVSKLLFLRENASALRCPWPGSENTRDFLLRKSISHIKDFDHFICVDLQGYEQKMGWKMA